MRVVNQSVPKVDSQALVTGKGVYTDDLAHGDCLIVKVLSRLSCSILAASVEGQEVELICAGAPNTGIIWQKS